MSCDKIFVVSNGFGLVGAFSSRETLTAKVLNKYKELHFLIQEFPKHPGQCEKVWFVLFKDVDAIAFASNDLDEAKRVHNMYDKFGLTYPDSIDYWSQSIDVVNPHAEERLNVESYVLSSTEEENEHRQKISEELTQKLFSDSNDFLKENEKISIVKHIIIRSEKSYHQHIV